MTNFSRSFAPKALVPVLAALCVAGCGPTDGLKELAEGQAAYQAGDYKKCEKLFLKSVSYNPANADTLVSLAQLKLRNGELKEAQEWIVKAEAIAAGDTDVRLLGAQIAWHAKDYAKAGKLFEGLALDTTLEPAIQAEGWVGLGIVQATEDEHELARISYLRAIRIDRRSASARYHLGHLYRYAPFGYSEAALEQFEAFVHLDSVGDTSSPRVQKTQRIIIPGLKETIARAATERPGVAQRNSAMSATSLTKAEAAAKKKNWKAAMTAYQDALTADPLSYPAALGLARMQLKVDTTIPAQRKALESYCLACALRPSAVATFIEAGRLAEKLQLPAQSRELYSRAMAANPASLDAIDGLIRSLKKANAEGKIIQAYQAYRDILPAARKK